MADQEKLLPEWKAWRLQNVVWNEEERERRKQFVSGYKPPTNCSVSQLNIQLYGQVGSGKSSFLNTINSVYKGRVSAQAMTGNQSTSLTKKYRPYEVRTQQDGEALCFRLCDTMGLEEANTGLHLDDVSYLLDGNVPDGYQFNADVRITPATTGFKSTTSLKDRPHCVVLVMDAKNISVMPEDTVDKLKAIYRKALDREIPTVILLTKIDKACEHIADDLSLVFRSKFILEKVEEVSGKFGPSETHIFPVQNYSRQSALDNRIDILALEAMAQILGFADDYLQNHLTKPVL